MTTGNAQETARAKAGLGFTAFRNLDIVQIANHVAGAFESLGHRVTGTHILSDSNARVTTAQFELVLVADADVALAVQTEPAGVYLSLAIAVTHPSRVSRFSRDSVLARTLQKLHELLQPDFVKWIDTDVVLSGEDFARALGQASRRSTPRARVTPRRVTARKRLPDIEETNDRLQRRITNHDPAIFEAAAAPDRLRKVFTTDWNDPDLLAEEAAVAAVAREDEDIEHAAPLRLSAWLISFAVALFSLPLGVMLMVLNLAKGENLRLASQTAALTGTFIAFQTFGTMAHAMQALQGVFG